jgi:DNA-binding transcriptional LysR family regulator
VTEELANGRLVRVLPAYVARDAALYVIHRGERFLPPKVRAFVDHMIEEVGAPTGSRP